MMVGQAGRLEGLYFIKSDTDTIELRQLYFPDAAPGDLDPMFTVFGPDQSRAVASTCMDILHTCGHLPDEATEQPNGSESTTLLPGIKETFMAEETGILTRSNDIPGRNEYTASLKNQEYLWIKVGEVDVCIKQDDEGLVVDLYARNGTAKPLASTWLHQSDVEADQEEAMTPDGAE